MGMTFLGGGENEQMIKKKRKRILRVEKQRNRREKIEKTREERKTRKK
jgi:hypothetical protein